MAPCKRTTITLCDSPEAPSRGGWRDFPRKRRATCGGGSTFQGGWICHQQCQIFWVSGEIFQRERQRKSRILYSSDYGPPTRFTTTGLWCGMLQKLRALLALPVAGQRGRNSRGSPPLKEFKEWLCRLVAQASALLPLGFPSGTNICGIGKQWSPPAGLWTPKRSVLLWTRGPHSTCLGLSRHLSFLPSSRLSPMSRIPSLSAGGRPWMVLGLRARKYLRPVWAIQSIYSIVL